MHTPITLAVMLLITLGLAMPTPQVSDKNQINSVKQASENFSDAGRLEGEGLGKIANGDFVQGGGDAGQAITQGGGAITEGVGGSPVVS